MKVGFAQINTTVGDFAGNVCKLAAAYGELVAAGAEVVISPELGICGYPPRDLVFHSRFVPANLEALERLAADVRGVPLVVGYVDFNRGPMGKPFLNAAAILRNGQVEGRCVKKLLPTYDVFDEARYFEPGADLEIFDVGGVRCGVTICEDIWDEKNLPGRLYARDPLRELAERGVDFIFNLSASPFEVGKPGRRLRMLEERSAAFGLPIAYCNLVGGNDQLVFDGNSSAVLPGGVIWRGRSFESELRCVDFNRSSESVVGEGGPEIEDVRRALVLGLRDYFEKCGFSSALLGLSGGIDSAVTACLACQALGADAVVGVLMPSGYSSEHSVEDARELALNLGMRTYFVPIEPAFRTLKGMLAEIFCGLSEDVTEENLQARIRGILLMALSNKLGSLLLTTGNKSELAVGYCTLYGDMCGGLAALSDVSKTMVYALARRINETEGRQVIPLRTLMKPPSAELRPGQRDQDTLPEYEVLDGILAAYVEENCSADEIVARGFEKGVVDWVLRRVQLNEYKRAQAAPGLKVSPRAFGFGRRIPIAQRFIT